ncbi:hypothetical protein L226DRAFT_471984 [Lentinus tigrinus ALCF2SS1-7]|uniref:Uncharacterized protein n=1 Tax=Lentinus tigrinus ALCF2SS1-6 TaxID=1328759 RepID=A0A5C2RTS1_9APHY|nr:hypothetical protein L227DRAFT_511865 [Lentinus tigrinus ALCF2SS1-6]RPD69236.1 hypothetical protein L226DRAFT_471984 [Lentinus tigrinus ALCF2SS1-7]
MANVFQAVDSGEPTLSEEFVQECFHSYLKSSLTHAKVEGLLDEDTLASAAADLMITGPALCLYFAALRSTTNPPSVPLPRRGKNGASLAPADLSLTNCPPAFRQFLLVWSQVVPSIQALTPEHQHDLARIICGLEPISSPLNPRLNGIAADLRAVAIEISMRRTFQEKYAGDLQVALDSGGAGRSPGGRSLQASFVPPPSYDDPSPHPSVPPSPQPSSTLHLPPILPLQVPPSPSRRAGHSPTPSTSSIGSSARSPSPRSDVFSPTILAEDVPGIEFIRETLYAALAEVLARKLHLRRLLRTDPTRAYFAAVALAITDVAASAATRPDASSKTIADLLPPDSPRRAQLIAETEGPVLRGVLGQTLALKDCPDPLKPFMAELCAIGKALHEMEDADSETAVRALQRGEEPPTPRLERVYDILEKGVGHAYRPEDVGREGRDGPADLRRRKTSTEGRAVAFANRINGLALGMTKLRAFRERQEIVFKVLAGVGS